MLRHDSLPVVPIYFPDLDLVVYMKPEFLGDELVEIKHLISNLAHRRMPT